MSERRDAQSWSAQGYTTNAGFVPVLGRAVLDLLDPRPGERILDLGCGDGVLTAQIAERGAVVVGVDTSPELLAAAEGRGLDARLMDGQRLAFEAEFDAVFSNAALHWMLDQDAVADGVRRALKPGGRFVAECGGHGNVAAIATALLAGLDEHRIDGTRRFPWVFPTPEACRARLERHGFAVLSAELIPRPTPLPTGIEGWLSTFANPFLAGLSDADRSSVVKHAVRLLAPSLRDEQGRWTADYVRLRFFAQLKSSTTAA
jgi:SAM-dependent methyltransferase